MDERSFGIGERQRDGDGENSEGIRKFAADIVSWKFVATKLAS